MKRYEVYMTDTGAYVYVWQGWPRAFLPPYWRAMPYLIRVRVR